MATVVLLTGYFLKRKYDFHLLVLAVALGFYMPMEISVPTFVGGFIRFLVKKKRKEAANGSDSGILFAAGSIAENSLMGVLIAFLLVNGFLSQLRLIPYQNLVTFLSFTSFDCVSWALYQLSFRKI